MPGERLAQAIFLTGLSGSGKSAVGDSLARRLKAKMIDTDRMIVRREHMSVRVMFEQKGEKYFRRRERDLILELCAELSKTGKKAIVSLGGGALLNPTIAARVKRCGTLIYLQVACCEAARRLLKSETRPLILDDSGNKLSHSRLTNRLRGLLKQRRTGFTRAHYRVPVGGRSLNEICTDILNRSS